MTDAIPGLRAAADEDSAGIIALIGGIWSTYPGIILDVDGEEPWMRRPATAFGAWGGCLWVVGPEPVACVGLRPVSAAATEIELKSLYVRADQRRRGLARSLVELVEGAARESGAVAVRLWSDTRFTEAHAFYARLGYIRTGQERALHDQSDTVEWELVKALG